MRRENYFGDIYPDLIHLWDFDKNGERTPYNTRVTDREKIWWKCEYDHVWKQSVDNQVRLQECLICKKISRSRDNLLINKCPELYKELFNDKNENGHLLLVTTGSRQFLWWECQVCHHQWRERVCDRTRRKYGCQKCRKAKISVTVRYPFILDIWDWKRNKDIQPCDVNLTHVGRGYDYHYRCGTCQHEWSGALAVVIENPSMPCPKCKQRSRSLGVLRSEILEMWNYKKNQGLDPFKITRHNIYGYAWLNCKKCNFEFEASIVSSFKKVRACPKCKYDISEQREVEERTRSGS